MHPYQDNPALKAATPQLIARLQAASSQDAELSELLSSAASALPQLLAHLESTSAEKEQQAAQIIKPSAWMHREQKYKQDLQEMRRKLAARDEQHTRLTAELAAASSGTLVEKLREDIRSLESANTDLSSKLSDMTARSQALANSSAAAGAAWRDICAGKRPIQTLGLEQGSSLRSSSSANGAIDSPAYTLTEGGSLPTNATIVVEHLSVSGAKAKLAQHQGNFTGASISTGGGFDRRTSTSATSTPLAAGTQGGSRAGSRRGSNSGSVFAAVLQATGTASAGGATPRSTGEAGAGMFGSPCDVLDVAGLGDLSTPAPAAPSEPGDDDGMLLDIDDLLGDLSAKASPAPAPLPAVPFPLDDLLGLDTLPGAQISTVSIAPPTHSTASSSDLPLGAFGMVDAALQVLAAPMADASTDAAGATEMADAACQGVVLAAAVENVGTQVEAVGVTAGTQCEVRPQSDSSSQTQELGLELPSPGVAAGVQATVLGEDAATQAGNTAAADAATQAGATAGADAATQADAAASTEAGTQADTTPAADAATQADAIVHAVPVSIPSLLEAPDAISRGLPDSASAADGEEQQRQRVAVAEQALAAAHEEATAVAEAAATLQAALAATTAELSTAKQQQQAALQQVAGLTSQVVDLQAALDTQPQPTAGEAGRDSSSREQQLELQVAELQQQLTDQSAGGSREVELEQQLAHQLVVNSRVAELEQQLSQQEGEVQEARAAAVRTAKALVVAQEQLAAASEALNLAQAEMVAMQEREEAMQLELQAYEHTMAGLKVAIEEADLEKNRQEAQNMEMAERLAFFNEFVSVKAKNPKNATLDYATWLKTQPKVTVPLQTTPSQQAPPEAPSLSPQASVEPPAQS